MIVMNNFKAEPIELREAMVNSVRRVLESGWYILGEEVAKFEKLWSGACGVAHGVGVGNGMDAIEISLRSLFIGAGDEVITTPMTAFATVLAIIRTGATPVLADINTDTGLLSIESVKRCLTTRTKAIVLVHLYGQVCDMDMWFEFCRDSGIFLIEDCAQAHMASWRGKCAGSFGDMSAYSFYPTKNLGAAGDGGMVMTNSESQAERARMLRNYGQSERYHHPVIGLNSRLDEIHAAMLSERMLFLPQFTLRRRQVAEIYRKEIHNKKVKLLAAPQDEASHVYHLFVVMCKERDALQEYLLTHSVQSLIHYPVPVHKQQSCLALKRDAFGLQNSESHAACCLSLPCHPQIADVEVETVVDVVNSF